MMKQATGYKLQATGIISDKNYLIISFFRVFILILAACGLRLTAGSCFAQEHSLSYYEVIEKRNFFRPEKKVSSKDKQNKINNAHGKKRDNSLGFVLTGIVKIRGKFKAIIEKSSGEGFYVGINENVEDYLVKDISADTVILQKDGKDFILKLKKSNSRDNTGSEVKNKEKIPQKEKNAPAKTGYEPNIIKRLRAGRSPAQR